MNQEYVELIVNIVVNTIDLVMIYYLCCNLIEKKALQSFRTITFGLLCGIFIGFAANYSNPYLFRLLIIIVYIIIFKITSKKKIYDVLILYAIIMICVLIAQLPNAIFLSRFQLDEIYVALIGQALTLFVIILAYKKAPLYKLLRIVEKEILLQLFFFILFGAGCIMLLYFKVEVSELKYHVLYFSILLLISFIGLYKTIKKVFFYTNKLPTLLHDLKHILVSMALTMNAEDDIAFIRKELNQYLKRMKLDVIVDEVKSKEYDKIIIAFIEHKKLESNKKLVFDMQISYSEHNPNFSFPFVIHTLGLLLDNAIEAVKTNAPICVKVIATDYIMLISVANEYLTKSKNGIIGHMFQVGYSTKSDKTEQKRGYGLSNLSKMVKELGGDILVEVAYNEEYKSTYLTIKVDFSTLRLKELLD